MADPTETPPQDDVDDEYGFPGGPALDRCSNTYRQAYRYLQNAAHLSDDDMRAIRPAARHKLASFRAAAWKRLLDLEHRLPEAYAMGYLPSSLRSASSRTALRAHCEELFALAKAREKAAAATGTEAPPPAEDDDDEEKRQLAEQEEEKHDTHLLKCLSQVSRDQGRVHQESALCGTSSFLAELRFATYLLMRRPYRDLFPVYKGGFAVWPATFLLVGFSAEESALAAHCLFERSPMLYELWFPPSTADSPVRDQVTLYSALVKQLCSSTGPQLATLAISQENLSFTQVLWVSHIMCGFTQMPPFSSAMRVLDMILVSGEHALLAVLFAVLLTLRNEGEEYDAIGVFGRLRGALSVEVQDRVLRTAHELLTLVREPYQQKVRHLIPHTTTKAARH